MKQVCILLVLLICWTINGFTEADSLSDYKIVKGNQVIKFVNKETDEVFHTYDIEANNPYQNLGFEKGPDGRNYIITDQNREKFLKIALPELTAEQKENLGHFIVAKTFSSFYVPPTFGATEVKHCLVTYDLLLLEDEGVPLDKYIGLIFNAKGEIIFRDESKNMGVFSPLVTNDGKYYAFSYEYETDNRGAISSGLRIYDLTSGTIIVDRNVQDEGYSYMSGPALQSIPMLYADFVNSYNYKLLFYDLDKRVVYSKIYPHSLFRQYFREICPDGYVFKKPNEKGLPGEVIQFDKFETDFEKETF